MLEVRRTDVLEDVFVCTRTSFRTSQDVWQICVVPARARKCPFQGFHWVSQKGCSYLL